MVHSPPTPAGIGMGEGGCGRYCLVMLMEGCLVSQTILAGIICCSVACYFIPYQSFRQYKVVDRHMS